MRAVFKYEVPIGDHVSISLPKGAQILSVQAQGDTPYLWALVDPDQPMIERQFRFAGTGHPITEAPMTLSHVGTFQFFKLENRLVFHLFEILSPEAAIVKHFNLF